LFFHFLKKKNKKASASFPVASIFWKMISRSKSILL
jgi:hypothetical protein